MVIAGSIHCIDWLNWKSQSHTIKTGYRFGGEFAKKKNGKPQGNPQTGALDSQVAGFYNENIHCALAGILWIALEIVPPVQV